MSTDVQNNLKLVLESINEAAEQNGISQPPLLVAVSKTKPSSMIQELYAVGQRRFGENYVQELEKKAAELAELCPDICWHYIGTIQTNKIAKLAAIESLGCVETLSSIKHCSTFQTEMAKRARTLRVMAQMNSSGEEQKGGGNEDDCIQMANFICNECPNLEFAGFMTIGSFDRDPNEFNPDFEALFKLREKWCDATGRDARKFSLSMGMSSDYIQAVKQGSTQVRVGSTIVGPRIYKKYWN